MISLPLVDRKHIYKAVNVCWYSFYRPRKDGKLSVNFGGKEGRPNIQPSTRPGIEPGIEPGTSGLGGRDLYHCINRSAMLHTWNKHTDGNCSTVRVVMIDFKKAFDLIDHRILAEKLLQYEIPTGILHWIIDFLTNRKQRVKLAQDCHSEWGYVAAGVPQAPVARKLVSVNQWLNF